MRHDTQMREGNLRQLVRLSVALYFIGMAMGVIPCPEGFEISTLALPKQMSDSLFSIGLFALAYFLLAGQFLRTASISLLSMVLLSRLNAPLDGLQFPLVRDAILSALLIYTGGFFMPVHLHRKPNGRMHLTRVQAPKGRSQSQNAIRAHAFSQSPDEMSILFDQIDEVR